MVGYFTGFKRIPGFRDFALKPITRSSKAPLRPCHPITGSSRIENRLVPFRSFRLATD